MIEILIKTMLERLQQIFREVFGDNTLTILPSTSAKDIKMWDSLTHLELIAAIEDEFKIKFSFDQVMKFGNVGDIIKTIENISVK